MRKKKINFKKIKERPIEILKRWQKRSILKRSVEILKRCKKKNQI